MIFKVLNISTILTSSMFVLIFVSSPFLQMAEATYPPVLLNLTGEHKEFYEQIVMPLVKIYVDKNFHTGFEGDENKRKLGEWLCGTTVNGLKELFIKLDNKKEAPVKAQDAIGSDVRALVFADLIKMKSEFEGVMPEKTKVMLQNNAQKRQSLDAAFEDAFRLLIDILAKQEKGSGVSGSVGSANVQY